MKGQGQASRAIGAAAGLVAAAAFSALGGIAGCGSDGEAAGKPVNGGSAGMDAGQGGRSGSGGAVSGSAGRLESGGGGGDFGGGPAGGTSSGAAGAPPEPCPSTAPANGSTCTVGYQCVYFDCQGAGQVNAWCNGSKVSTEVLPCANLACGARECEPGTICVQRMGGMTVQCQENPCGERALTCGCAGNLCAVTESCNVTGTTVHCN